MKLGIDIGSTTVKLVVIDDENKIIYKRYERHMSNVMEKVTELLEDLYKTHKRADVQAVITGSGGLALSELMGVYFEQEVVSCSKAVETLIPQTDVVIELGGEDAKITFYGQSIEQQMNGTCAGGTGAFIDQMAVLLNTDAQGLNEAAKNHKIIYPIAARCGVFAKTDIQPLINDGAAIEDLAASIFQAVVNQTISGLACGRQIKGNIAFLGGPLSFLSELRARFIETLQLTDEQVIFPEDSKYFVAIGAAMLAEKQKAVPMKELYERIKNVDPTQLSDTKHMEPLFKDEEDYREFKERHDKDKIKRKDISEARGNVYLGIDAGSTTTKAALIDDDKNLLCSEQEFYEKEIEALKRRISKLMDLYTNEYITLNEFNEKKKEIDTTMNEYNAKLNKLITNKCITPKTISERLAECKDIITNSFMNYKEGATYELLVDSFVDRIVVSNDKLEWHMRLTKEIKMPLDDVIREKEVLIGTLSLTKDDATYYSKYCNDLSRVRFDKALLVDIYLMF